MILQNSDGDDDDNSFLGIRSSTTMQEVQRENGGQDATRHISKSNTIGNEGDTSHGSAEGSLFFVR